MMTGLHIVELFAGLCGWSSAAGPDDAVVTTDLELRFGTTITADVREPLLGPMLLDICAGRVDLVLASPPCEAFSTMTMGRSWHSYPRAPKTPKAALGLELVERTRELIAELSPAFYVIENPVAMLRKMPVMGGLERRTVTYCQLGEPTMKPTDLWGEFPPSLELPPPCKAGDPCHIAAPRGSRTGIQGSELYPDARGDELAALRAKVPYRLSELVIEAARRDLAAGLAPSRPQTSLWEK